VTKSTGHGHVVPRPDGVRARCGGPGLCHVCQMEVAALGKRPAPSASAVDSWCAFQAEHPAEAGGSHGAADPPPAPESRAGAQAGAVERCFRFCEHEWEEAEDFQTLAAARAEHAALRGALEQIIENYDARVGVRGHHLGCDCGGTRDGLHSCRTFVQAIESGRAALAAWRTR